jgi:hypothetical protein
MYTQTIVTQLTILAEKSHELFEKPEAFALKAALLATKEMISPINPGTADAAVLVASTSFIKLSEVAMGALSSSMTSEDLFNNRFNVNEEGRGGHTNLFIDFVGEAPLDTKEDELKRLYVEAFEQEGLESPALTLNIARSNFMHAYVASFNAYILGISNSASVDDTKKNETFKKIVHQSLSKSLLCEPLDAGFFMTVLCSESFKHIATTILLAGMIALSLGDAGIYVPLISGLVGTSIGASNGALAATGAVLSVSSAVCFTGRFFAVNKQHKSIELGREAVSSALSSNISLEGIPG